MSRRLRVLLSAYSCEPGKGSEPEVGWQWARQMARWHDVTVLTRANNEPAIREGLRREGEMPGLRFVFHDLSPRLLALKKRLGWHDLYYRRWQASARGVIARLCRETAFDLLHHVTYAGARFPTAIFGHGVRTIWGPVGGFESMPTPFLPWKYPRELAEELLRNAANAIATATGALRRRAARANLVIVSTKETACALEGCARARVQPSGRAIENGERAGARPSVVSDANVRVRLLPTIGIHLPELPPPGGRPAAPLRLLFAGRLLYWKGLELALQALAASQTEAHLTVVGQGRFRRNAEELARTLGLAQRVQFVGQVPQEAMLAQYQDYDAMLYPSLHDTGGFVLLEAMARRLPVICLACGGPALIVTAGCGFCVPLGSRASVIAHLAAAIRQYGEEPALLRQHGEQARLRVGEHYAWDKKGETMNAFYEEVMAS